MTTSHVPTLGLVEVPAMGEVLRQVGYRVISGSTFPEAASAVKTAVDDVQAALAAQQAAAVFPILIADVHRPGIKAWAQKSSRTSPVLILRGGADESQNYIVANEAREIRLPATVAAIVTAAALPVAPDPRMQLVVMPDGSVVDPQTHVATPAAPVAQVPVAPALPVQPTPSPTVPSVQSAPAPTVPVAPVASPAPAAAPVQHFAQPVPVSAPVVAEPAPALQTAPVQPTPVAAPATTRAPWDTREEAAPVIAAEPAGPEAPVEVPTFERAPQLLFPDTAVAAAPATEQWQAATVAPATPAAPVAPVPVAAEPTVPVDVPAWASMPTAPAPAQTPVAEVSPSQVAPMSPEWSTAPAEQAWAQTPVTEPGPVTAAPVSPEWSAAPLEHATTEQPSWALPQEEPPAPAWAMPPVAPQQVAAPEPLPVAPVAPVAPAAPAPAPTPVAAPAPVAARLDIPAPQSAEAVAIPAPVSARPQAAPAPAVPEWATDIQAPPGPPVAAFEREIPRDVSPAPVSAGGHAAMQQERPELTQALLASVPGTPQFGISTDEPVWNPATFAAQQHATAISNAAPLIFCWAYKGGVNKTSLSLQLAHRAAEMGLRVWLIDMNRGQGGVRTVLRIPENAPVRSAFDAARMQNPSRAFVKPQEVQPFRPKNLEPLKFGLVLAPPRVEADAAATPYTAYRQIIDYARANGDLVIVDTQTVEAVDNSGLISNVMVPMMIDDAWGVAITAFAKESVENLKAALADYGTRGLTRDRQLLVVTRADKFQPVDAQGVEKTFQPFAHFAGTTKSSEFVKQSFDEGVVISDDETVRPVLDSVLVRVTGDSRFASQPVVAAKGRRRGLLGGRRR